MLKMTDKQTLESEETPIPTSTILEYNIDTTSIHYILHNLFRGLKPVRRKYKLTINEIIFLNGIYLYCRHINTCISQDACMKFIGYYNLHKIKYYIGSLHAKGMIQVAEIVNGYNRYKLTPLCRTVMDDINDGFERCLYYWLNKYSISL
jgi:hypothetical protein